MSGFTPGPWATHPQWRHIYADGDFNCVVSMSPTFITRIPNEQDLANLRLIAAAPELLEALIGLLEMADFVSENVPEAGWRMAQHTARTAIAKATGEQA